MPSYGYHDIATRTSVIMLKCPLMGKSNAEISAQLGIPARIIDNIYAKAIQRGFDPYTYPIVIKNAFIKDAPKSGRPIKNMEEFKEIL